MNLAATHRIALPATTTHGLFIVADFRARIKFLYAHKQKMLPEMDTGLNFICHKRRLRRRRLHLNFPLHTQRETAPH